MVELSSCFLKGNLLPVAFLRVWRGCKSEPGLKMSSFLPQNSLEKSRFARFPKPPPFISPHVFCSSLL